jgi:hypothetical protein
MFRITPTVTSYVSRYNRSAYDRTHPDHDETVFGHLVLEMGLSVEQALTKLKPLVKDYAQSTEKSKLVCASAGGIGIVIGILIGASPVGIGFSAIIPALAGLFAGSLAWDSNSEEPQRNAEYAVLRTAPGLLKVMYALSKRGLKPEILVESYDELIQQFGSYAGEHSHLGMDSSLDFGEAAIVQSFQGIFEEKAAIALHSNQIIDEWSGEGFEAVYKDGRLPKVQPPGTPAIGSNTRLNSIEVPGVEQSSFVDLPSVLGGESNPWNMPTGFSEILADPYQSRAFFGAQRTGKSYFSAVSSRELNHALSCKIFHLNLASFGDEDSYYWSHATETIQCDLSAMDAFQASQIIKKAIELVQSFYRTQNAILIVDEIAYLGSTSNQHSEILKPLLTIIADKITTLSSSGKKRQQAVWTIAPEFVAGSLVQDAKAVKKLKLCYVSIHPDRSTPWNGQEIGFDWELFNQIKANFTISDPEAVPNSDRICFIGSHWLPVGELPDLKKMATPKTLIQKPVEHLEKSLEASEEDSGALFTAWSDYPIHQAVLRYLHGKSDRSPREIYDALRNSRKTVNFDSIEAPSDIEKVRIALRYLRGKGYISQDYKGKYTLSPNINTR